MRKGESGIKIFYPRYRTVEQDDAATGERRTIRMLNGFGLGNVFDVLQTDGDPLPEPPRSESLTRVDSVSAEVNLRLSRYLIDEGVQLSSEQMDGLKGGYWNPRENKIAIRADAGVEVFAAGKTRVLAHEAAHREAGHTRGDDRVTAEAVAESCAFVVMHHFGIHIGTASFPYLAGWAQDVSVLRANLQAISETSRRIIAGIEGVEDPYTDGGGSWESRDEDAAIKDMAATEEAIVRETPDRLWANA